MTEATVTHTTDGDRTVVRISGDLDFTSVSPVTDELEHVLAESGGSLVLDLSSTTFLDSAGVKLLYELSAVMRNRGADVRMVVPPANLIHRTLALSGAYETLPIEPSLEEPTAGSGDRGETGAESG